MSKKFGSVYQFKIELLGITPAIWRRIQVPDTYNFWELHVAIQDAMSWWDYHLHEFLLNNRHTGKSARIGMPSDDFDIYDENDMVIPEAEEKIAEWFSLEPLYDKARYNYDFGDDWQHEIVLEDILPRDKSVNYPICLAGERTCAPEDCGGIRGYADLLETIADPENEDYEDMLTWLGGRFDPEHFVANEVEFDDPTERWSVSFGGREGIKLPLLYARPNRKWSSRIAEEDEEGDSDDAGNKENGHNNGHVRQEKTERPRAIDLHEAASANALRLDVISVLGFIGDRQIKLTQTGNMTLKDLRAVNERFAEPEELDKSIGSHAYKLRTEDEVRRIPFLRGLAQKAGLIKIRNNKISQTGMVKTFLKKEPYDQLKQLLIVWLTKDDWGRPFGEPKLFEPIMDKVYSIAYHISRMKVGERVEYEVFEKELFDEMQLIFSSGDPERDKFYSYWAVADALLEPLEQLGVVSLEKIPGKFMSEKVSAVKLTELGKSFLVG